MAGRLHGSCCALSKVSQGGWSLPGAECLRCAWLLGAQVKVTRGGFPPRAAAALRLLAASSNETDAQAQALPFLHLFFTMPPTFLRCLGSGSFGCEDVICRHLRVVGGAPACARAVSCSAAHQMAEPRS